MTFSGDLAAWLCCCTAGLIAATLSFRYAWMIRHAVLAHGESQFLIDGTRHLQSTELERVVGWLMFLTIGVIASVQRPSGAALEQPPIGSLLRWLLVGTIALWSFKTISDYLFARSRWLRSRRSTHETRS